MMNGGIMDGGNMMWNWGGMIFGPFMMFLFIGVIVTLIVLFVRWIGGTGSGPKGSGKRSLELLKERFARGEIDSQEYEDRRRVLLD